MTLDIGTYEEAVAAHEWRVPERYNIAVDCCDKHPADKLAMIHEDFEGTVRRDPAGASCRSGRTASRTCCAPTV